MGAYYKKIFNKIKYLLLLSPLVLVLSSCSNKYLSTPKNLEITDDCYLVWDKVNNATGYEVLVSNTELGNSLYTVNDNKFDVLSILSNTEEFKFKVCAKDSTNKYQESNDSKELSFKTKSQLEYFDFTFNEAGYYSMSMKRYIIKTPNNPFGEVYTYSDKVEGVFVIPTTYNGFPVKELKNACFECCINTTNIYMPDSIDKLGFNIFCACNNLKRVRLSQNLEELSDHMFSNCSSLSELIIPDNISKIGKKVFYNCDDLEKIKIGENVTTILENNFSSCDNLKEIIIDDNNPNYYYKDGCLIDKNENSIIGVTSLNFKKIPEYISIIGKYAFSKCETISKLEIPPNIVEIKERAFYDCQKIKEILIPGTIKILGAGSFSRCNSIEEVVIPSTLKNIGGGIFSECSNLKKATVEEGIEKYDNWFIDCENLEEINLPSTIKNMNEYLWRGMKNLQTINIPEENEYFKIDQNCLIDINNKKLLLALKNPSIPDYIETICFESFINSNVESITIPSSVRLIDIRAFSGLSSLKTLIFQEGVKTIEADAFHGCYNLLNIVLPNSIERLKAGVFSNCYSTIIIDDCPDYIEKDALTSNSIYTSISHRRDNTETFGLSNCSICFDCDIEDGILKSFHYYYYVEKPEPNVFVGYSSYIGDHTTIDINWYRMRVTRIPYRDGYEFLGFSFTEGSDYPDIPIELFEPINENDDDIAIKKKYISFSNAISKNIENDTILYAVWRKIS